MSFNKQAVFAVFTDADNSSASFTERLLALGVGDRATARPLAMEWAAVKYDAKITQGQRGAMLPRNSAAEQAVKRVLAILFPNADKPKAKAKRAANNKTDAVAKLLKSYNALTGAEKRRFLASI